MNYCKFVNNNKIKEHELISKYAKIFPPINNDYSLYIISLNNPHKPKKNYKFYENGIEIIGKYNRYIFSKNNNINPNYLDLHILSRMNNNKYYLAINNVYIDIKLHLISVNNNFYNIDYAITDLYNENIDNIINNLAKLLYYYNINYNII
jgi:hypothetical protein